MSNQEKGREKDKSFWQTLPGILTAITSLVVAVTGLITVLAEKGIIGPTPTEFPTNTPVNTDVTLPPPLLSTLEPVGEVPSQPTCQSFTEYKNRVNPNAVLLAFTETDMWVQYGGIDEEVASQDDLTAYIFGTSPEDGACLYSWVKYLLNDHNPNWPSAASDTGRTYNEVWLTSPQPTIVGELASWPQIPDIVLITTVDENANPGVVQIYLCGKDIPSSVLSRVAYWHAATSEQALQDHFEQYVANGYTEQPSVPCGN